MGAVGVQAARAIAKPFWQLARLGTAGLLAAACVREVDSSNPGGSAGAAGVASVTAGSSAGGSAAQQPAVTCVEPAPGAAPIRRLTRFELNNTLRDLLGDTTRAGDQLPPELKGNGFSNDAASLTTTRVLVDAYRTIADGWPRRRRRTRPHSPS